MTSNGVYQELMALANRVAAAYYDSNDSLDLLQNLNQIAKEMKQLAVDQLEAPQESE